MKQTRLTSCRYCGNICLESEDGLCEPCRKEYKEEEERLKKKGA